MILRTRGGICVFRSVQDLLAHITFFENLLVCCDVWRSVMQGVLCVVVFGELWCDGRGFGGGLISVARHTFGEAWCFTVAREKSVVCVVIVVCLGVLSPPQNDQ